MITQVLGEVPAELHVTPEQDERLAEQARRVGAAEVVRLLELIAAALRAMKDGADARTQLELALVKAATPDLEPSVKALQARLARLESRPGGAPVPPAVKTPERAETAAGAAPRSRRRPRRSDAPPSPPEPERGRTEVTISAQVEGQPPVAVSATLPGAGNGTARSAQEAADGRPPRSRTTSPPSRTPAPPSARSRSSRRTRRRPRRASSSTSTRSEAPGRRSSSCCASARRCSRRRSRKRRWRAWPTTG